MSESYAIITGASSGIGKEFAKILADEGFNLILVARNKKRLNNLKKDILKKNNIKIDIIIKDLSTQRAALEIYNRIKNKDIEILINNAGFGLYGKFSDTDLNKEINMINLNIISLTVFTKLILKKMIKRNRGKILNVASTAAFQPVPYFSVYSAGKSYVLNFTLAISEEIKNKNIVISCLAPGATKTPFFKTANILKTRLSDSKLMSPEKCAKIGYKGLLKRKKLIIPGTINKIRAFGVKIVPRCFINMVTKYIMRRKRG